MTTLVPGKFGSRWAIYLAVCYQEWCGPFLEIFARSSIFYLELSSDDLSLNCVHPEIYRVLHRVAVVVCRGSGNANDSATKVFWNSKIFQLKVVSDQNFGHINRSGFRSEPRALTGPQSVVCRSEHEKRSQFRP